VPNETDDLGLPPGQRRAAGHPVLAELTPAGCRELLAPGGVGRFLPDPAGRAVAARLGIEPWAGGQRDLVLRLTPREVTGRRIRAVR